MSATYYIYPLSQPEDTHDIQIVQIGTKQIELDIQWAIASAEQLAMILKKFAEMATCDPIQRKTGLLDRSYNYLEYYFALFDKDLGEWVDSDPELPISLVPLTRDRKITLLTGRIKTCMSMMPIVKQYVEVLRWQIKVTCDGDSTVSVVQPGGWYRNQDNSFAFRYLTPLEHVDQEQLGSVVMQFEVYDE